MVLKRPIDPASISLQRVHRYPFNAPVPMDVKVPPQEWSLVRRTRAHVSVLDCMTSRCTSFISPAACTWSPWLSGQCSVTCGTGTYPRVRICRDPSRQSCSRCAANPNINDTRPCFYPLCPTGKLSLACVRTSPILFCSSQSEKCHRMDNVMVPGLTVTLSDATVTASFFVFCTSFSSSRAITFSYVIQNKILHTALSNPSTNGE